MGAEGVEAFRVSNLVEHDEGKRSTMLFGRFLAASVQGQEVAATGGFLDEEDLPEASGEASRPEEFRADAGMILAGTRFAELARRTGREIDQQIEETPRETYLSREGELLGR
jgi:hypothetical protein